MAASDPKLFETIVGSLSDGIYVMQEGKAVFLNSRFSEIFGFPSVVPLLGKDMFGSVYPDRATAELFRLVHEQVLNGDSCHVAWGQPSARVDGTPFWLEAEARRVELGGKPAIIGTFHDRTDCKLMGEAMHASQETLRLLLDAMEDRVYVVTDDYRIVYANRKMQEGVLGDISRDPCYRVCRGLPDRCEDCSTDTVFTSDKPVHKEIYNQVTKRWYSVIELAIRMPGVERPTKLAVARDITVRKEGAEKIRALSHRLLTAQEEERRHLSRELHDGVGQQLNALKLGLETLMPELEEQCRSALQVRRMSEVLAGSIECIRHITRGLRPPALERLGLVEAIREHCNKVSQMHPLAVDFRAAGVGTLSLDPGVEINLFRILQEGLHNVVKHASASKATVRLLVSHPRLILKIEDNGRGMAKADLAGNAGGLGMVGMAERVDLLGGKFSCQSRPGEGTRIGVEVPIAETEEEMERERRRKQGTAC